MTELAKRAAQRIRLAEINSADYALRLDISTIAEIIDSAGVRELTEALELSKTRYENVLELLREAVGSDKESGLHYERCICWRCKTLGTLRIIDEAVLARIKGGQ